MELSNAERSQHPHPIFAIVTPPACHGLFFQRALVRQRGPPACCFAAHLCRHWLFRRSGFRRSRPRGMPHHLDLSDSWQICSLGISLLRPGFLMRTAPGGLIGKIQRTCSAELLVLNETIRSPSVNRSTLSTPFVVCNPSLSAMKINRGENQEYAPHTSFEQLPRTLPGRPLPIVSGADYPASCWLSEALRGHGSGLLGPALAHVGV